MLLISPEILESDRPTIVYDFAKLKQLYALWVNRFPNIHAHYAVKCNPNAGLIATIGNQGGSFDCASPNEIDTVIGQGCSAEKIIYANPCKTVNDIVFALEKHVTLTTFDSICELDKISYACDIAQKRMKLVLRIYASDPTAKCVLSNKYGAMKHEWDGLLRHAHDLGLDVVGVSFHVGSGACDPSAFSEALCNCKHVCNIATNYGFTVNVVDIGGGFTVKNIELMSTHIKQAINTNFTADEQVHIKFIAEPGRFFAESIATLYTKIIGVKERGTVMHYIVNDSIYGCFSGLVFDHLKLDMPDYIKSDRHVCCTQCIQCYRKDEEKKESIIFGETCDGSDVIFTGMMRCMTFNDLLVWYNMGAYSIASACNFNGIQLTTPKYVYLL
jgi:ornithine decarboxylase